MITRTIEFRLKSRFGNERTGLICQLVVDDAFRPALDQFHQFLLKHGLTHVRGSLFDDEGFVDHAEVRTAVEPDGTTAEVTRAVPILGRPSPGKGKRRRVA
jgi:hypothetical protein